MWSWWAPTGEIIVRGGLDNVVICRLSGPIEGALSTLKHFRSEIGGKSKRSQRNSEFRFVRLNQKKPDVRDFSARNSGAGNGCTNFMGAWHFLVLPAGKPAMPIKFLVLVGDLGFLEGGVEVRILFLWAWRFFRLKLSLENEAFPSPEQSQNRATPMQCNWYPFLPM